MLSNKRIVDEALVSCLLWVERVIASVADVGEDIPFL